MPQGPMNVEQFVEVLRAAGLDEATMRRYHTELERRYPEGHQSFLEWLNVTAEKIAEIRGKSAGEWAK